MQLRQMISAPVGRAVRGLVVTGVALLVVGLLVGLVLVGRHGTGPARGLDRHVWSWSVAHRYLIGPAKVIATWLDAAPLGGICVLLTVALVLWLRSVLGLVPIVAYLGGEGLVFLVRVAVHRPRPPSAIYPGPHALAGVHETSWSFPSGHATAVTAVLFACLGVLALRRSWRWPWPLAALLAAYVADSRLDLGVHWFTDVLTGYVLGAVWGVVVALVSVRLAAAWVPPASAAPRHGVPASRYERPRHSTVTGLSTSGPDDGP
jgi:undecaprenyl-diphosphatase